VGGLHVKREVEEQLLDRVAEQLFKSVEREGLAVFRTPKPKTRSPKPRLCGLMSVMRPNDHWITEFELLDRVAEELLKSARVASEISHSDSNFPRIIPSAIFQKPTVQSTPFLKRYFT
jgi:hypothetical protein